MRAMRVVLVRAGRRLLACCTVAAAIVLGASAAPSAAQAAGDAGGAGADAAIALPACVGVTTEARYVPYGYNHVVLLKNGCSRSASCSVATDVNPRATSVELAALTSTEVLTFAGSPSQTFSARVTCVLAGPPPKK